MNEKLYLFNPFNIKSITEKELQQMYQEVYKRLVDEPNTLYQYSTNREVIANLMYICGEVVARLTKDIEELKTKIEIDRAVNTTDERKKWNEEDGKTPAIDYFKAQATRMSKEDISKLADKECSLKRFKNAYECMEHKMNAIKSQIDSIKYEEFGSK